MAIAQALSEDEIGGQREDKNKKKNPATLDFQ